MKYNQMSDEERKAYTMLLNKAKPELKRHRCEVIIASTVVSLAVLGVIIWYWITPTIAVALAFRLGGQLYALWGALLLVLGAVSSPYTFGMMCMTFPDGNPKLFEELMKSQFSAIVGVCFIVGGFSIQSFGMLLFGS
ncbi:hypothetical protein ES703_65995 [subsurface metagenome]